MKLTNIFIIGILIIKSVKIQKTAVFTLILLFSVISQVASEDPVSDPEVEELKTRIKDVSYELTFPYYSDGSDTGIKFTISLEYWNPYDEEFSAYEDHFCIPLIRLDINFVDEYKFRNNQITCTSAYSQWTYPAGISSETTFQEIIIIGNNGIIPDGYIIINGRDGFYDNSTDNFHGAKMKITSGEILIEYEDYPEDWGQILFTKTVFLEMNIFPIMLITAILGIIGKKLQNRR